MRIGWFVGLVLCGKQPGERVVALRHMVVIKACALVGDIPHRNFVAVFCGNFANALYQRAFQMLRVVLCPVRDADGVVLPNEVVSLGLCAYVLAKFRRRVCRRAAVDIGAVLFEATVPLSRLVVVPIESDNALIEQLCKPLSIQLHFLRLRDGVGKKCRAAELEIAVFQIKAELCAFERRAVGADNGDGESPLRYFSVLALTTSAIPISSRSIHRSTSL